MERSIYIISKPYQYFNVCNIEDHSNKTLIIVNAFSGSEDLYLNIKNKSHYWDEVFFCNNYSEAFNLIYRISKNNLFRKLFIDGDYSLSMIKELQKLKNIDIFVFEEGLGSYTDNIRKVILKNKFKNGNFKHKLKWILTTIYLKLKGHDDHHGGFKGTKGIYVYNHELHKLNKPNFKKEILSFKNSFLDHLRKFEDRKFISSDYSYLMEVVKDKKVLIYLTSWQVDSKIESIIEEYPYHVRILKPHPHIVDDKLRIIQDKFDFNISGGNMVEFLISDLIDVSKELIVVHNNSSALMHLKNSLITEIIL
mgnify:CR=1 FL=1